MNIQELVQTGCPHRGVTVEGVILVGPAILTQNPNDPASIVIELPHDQVEHMLFNGVPAYGGGSYCYHDDAAVTGTVEMDPWRFTNITRITIFRDEEWTVEPPGRSD